MTPVDARYAEVKAIFLDALERPVSEREALVRRRAGDDDGLAREVLELLAHQTNEPLLRADTDPLGIVGEVVDARYRVVSLVGEGGFSWVYRAEHVRWEKPVALKILKLGDGTGVESEVARAFVREGALLDDLSRRTSSIVRSYDVGTWRTPSGRSVLFTALEWLEGETLAERLRRERARGEAPGWSLPEVLRTLEPVARALAVAHEAGVAHRDVKPSNVFLATSEGGERVKLLDFGVAKVAAGDGGFHASTGAGRAVTFAYAAPEQVLRAHGPTGPWTDVYALALVAVELLGGRHPTRGKDVEETMARACDPRHRPTPRAEGVAVSDALEEVFAAALAVSTDARPRDAGRFWDALTAACADASPVTPRSSPSRGVLAAALVVVAVVLVIAVRLLR